MALQIAGTYSQLWWFAHSEPQYLCVYDCWPNTLATETKTVVQCPGFNAPLSMRLRRLQ